jgi:hypothetical protein
MKTKSSFLFSNQSSKVEKGFKFKIISNNTIIFESIERMFGMKNDDKK